MKRIKKQFWVSEEFNNYFINLCEKAGISQTKLFEQNIINSDKLLNHLVNKNEISNTFKILKELKKQGNNLNQIAHYTNIEKLLDIKILEEIKKIKEQQEEIKRMILK